MQRNRQFIFEKITKFSLPLLVFHSVHESLWSVKCEDTKLELILLFHLTDCVTLTPHYCQAANLSFPQMLATNTDYELLKEWLY